jgi:hypothetical protein
VEREAAALHSYVEVKFITIGLELLLESFIMDFIPNIQELEVITMTKFEQIGVNYQYDANNVYEANKAFSYSCTCCCAKGIHLDCDKCAIACAHAMVTAYFNDKKKGK